jgi:hypothetical protein
MIKRTTVRLPAELLKKAEEKPKEPEAKPYPYVLSESAPPGGHGDSARIFADPSHYLASIHVAL